MLAPTPPTMPAIADRPSPISASAERWALAGVVALAAALRFTTVAGQSFWYDEAVTHGIVSGSLGHVLSTVPQTESTPYLYYVLAWLWTRLAGSGEAGLRSLSALAGTLTVPVLWALGRRLVSPRVGLVAAALAAVDPFLVWYSQEARSYALLTLLSAVALLLAVRARERGDLRAVLGFGLAGAAALATHYFAVLALVPTGVWLLAGLRRAGRLRPGTVLAAAGPGLAVALALIPLLVRQNDGRAGYIADAGGSVPFRLAQLVKQDLVGFDGPAKTALSVLAVLVVAWSLVPLVRAERTERRTAATLAGLAAAGIAIALLSGATGTDYTNSRNLLPTFPALALVVAVGLGGAHAGRAELVALAGFVVIALVTVIGVAVDPLYQRQDWRGAARALGPARAVRAIVANHQELDAFAPYLPGVGLYPPAGAPIGEIDIVALDYRRPGARENTPPAALPPRPELAGWRLAGAVRTRSYSVVRLVPLAGTPLAPSAVQLELTAFDPRSAVVLRQSPAPARR